ncbi:MAG: T9SS type A sorting domain-containing protein [Chitinophagales bacterium]|nr:T9SS type A sorting domain-containing protein [Chitinophagales bacterium]
MKKHLLLLVFVCLFLPFVQAQKNVRVVVTEVSTNIGDCDFNIFGTNDSDPIWWWSVNGTFEGCFETTCNGCTQNNLGQVVYDKSFSCAEDFPSNISIGFSGCENDGASCDNNIWLIFTGICDGDVGSLTAGSRSDNIAINSTNGTYNVGPYTVTSRNGTFGGCVGNFTYKAVVQVSGNYSIPNDNICEATVFNPGGDNLLESAESAYIAGQSNDAPCVDGQPNEPNDPNKTVWYKFSTGANVGTRGHVELKNTYCNGFACTFIPWLGLYKGSFNSCNDLGGLQEIVTSPDVIGSTSLDFCPEPNTNYFLQVDKTWLSGWAFNFDVEVSMDNSTAGPDDICEARNISGTGPYPKGQTITLYNQSNRCAGKQSGEPTVDNILHDGSAFRDLKSVWYYFETDDLGGKNACLDVTLTSGNLDGHVSIFKKNGDCNSFSNISFIAEGGLAGGGNDLTTKNDHVFTTNIQPNSTYYIQVIGNAQDLPGLYDAHQGEFDLVIELNEVAPNDDFCAALNVNGAGIFAVNNTVTLTDQTNRCATKQSSEPQVDNILHDGSLFRDCKSLWYYLETGDLKGESACLTTELYSLNNTIDGHITIYKANGNCNSFGNLAEIAEGGLIGGGNDLTRLDDNTVAYGIESFTRYYIQVIGNVQDLPGLYNAHIGEFNLVVSLHEAPNNDNLCNAKDISGNVGLNQIYTLENQSNRCASKQDDEPKVSSILHDASAFRNAQSVWYKVNTPDLTGQPYSLFVALKSLNETIDGHVVIYKANGDCNSFGNLEEVEEGGFELGGGNILGTFDDYTRAFNVQSNTTYYIQVFGEVFDLPGMYNAHQGEFNLSVGLLGIPTNDMICNATELGAIGLGDAEYLSNQSSYNATSEADEPNTFSTFYDVPTVWYTFTTNADANLVPNGASLNVHSKFDIDAHIAVYAATNTNCGVTNISMLAEGGLPGTGLNDILTKDDDVSLGCLQPNTRYYVQISGWEIALQNTHHGIFDLSLQFSVSSRPPHDDICNAIELINSGSPQFYNNNCASLEIGEPVTREDDLFFDLVPTNTVWHKFKTPASTVNSVRAVISTDQIQTNFDTEITLWYSRDGSCKNTEMVQIGFSDDIQLLINEKSRIEADELIPDATYYVQVDGDDEGETGTYGITLDAGDGAPLPEGPIYHHYYYARPNQFFKYEHAFLIVPNLPPVKAEIRKKGANTTWDFSHFPKGLQTYEKFYEPDGIGAGAAYVALCDLACDRTCEDECGTNDPFDPCYAGCTLACPFDCADEWDKFNLAEQMFPNLKLGSLKIEDLNNVFEKSTSALEIGAASMNVQGNIPIVVPYSQRDKLLGFPFYYQHNFQNHSKWNVDLSLSLLGVNLYMESERDRRVVTEGYGVLKTNHKTYPNALKVKSVSKIQFDGNLLDQLQINNESLPDWLLADSVVTYEWYVPGYEQPIVKVFATIENNQETMWDAQYLRGTLNNVPTARFSTQAAQAINANMPIDKTIRFSNLSEEATHYVWNFGDGSTSTIEHPQHVYQQNGKYLVTLTAKDDLGQQDVFTQEVVIWDETNRESIKAGLVGELGKIKIQSDITQAVQLNAYPNPFRDQFVVSFMPKQSEPITLTLMNELGQVVLVEQFTVDGGSLFTHNVSLKDKSLSPGLYILTVQMSDGMVQTKLMKE